MSPLFIKRVPAPIVETIDLYLSPVKLLLLERAFQDHLLKNISLHKTISCHQHGFQSRCSCISQLIDCLNDCTDRLDNTTSTDVIYLDFAKTFDTVPHKSLIHKLRA